MSLMGGSKLSEKRRRVARDVDPLKHRRVRDAGGRLGTITMSYNGGTGGRVHWDDLEKPWHNERVDDLDALTMLDAPEIAVPVIVRKVLFRGHKDQVAEYVAALRPLSEEAVARGASRYVEFDPQPAAYRRWRVIYQGAPMTPEQVSETPDQYPGAERLRKIARDNNAYEEPDSYGW